MSKRSEKVMDALMRAETLLVAVQDFIYVNSLQDYEVDYDDATCDGHCLMEDAEHAVSEIRGAIIREGK